MYIYIYITAATGVKNQRHKSHTDEVVYLYLHTCSAQNAYILQLYTLQRIDILQHTISNVKTETK